VANVIVAQMLFLESEDPDKDINLYINSPGGSVTSFSPWISSIGVPPFCRPTPAMGLCRHASAKCRHGNQ